MTAGPIAMFSMNCVLLLSSCGSAGMGGEALPAPEPLQFLSIAENQDVGAPPLIELFASDEPLELVLASDFDQLGKDRSQEAEERAAQLFIRAQSGEGVEIPIRVKTRGIFRLKKQICSDPPLRLNLSESLPKGTVLDGEDKLKLVTHCRDSDRYEQNLLEEYLAYRIYNQLTDMSFKVQLASVTYLDTSGKSDPVRRMAFLIEDEDALALRLVGRMMESPAANPRDFVQEQLGLMYLFQYMVGNVDWGLGPGHNVKYLRTDQGHFPIPYDFDWSGLVDAPYAGPTILTESIHESVRERVYWGACLAGMDYQELFARFNSRREEIMAMARSQVGLSERNLTSAVSYLEEFYDVINDPRAAERAILKACRK